MEYDFSNELIHKLHKRIGTNVKKIRTEKGLAQLKLSYAMGTSLSVLYPQQNLRMMVRNLILNISIKLLLF